MTVSTEYVAGVYVKAEFHQQPPESRHFERVTFARSIITSRLVRSVVAVDYYQTHELIGSNTILSCVLYTSGS